MLSEFRRRLLDLVGTNDFIAAFADPTRRIIDIDTFAYTFNYTNVGTPITATAPQTINQPIDTNSDFVCLYLMGAARVSGVQTLTFNPALLVQVTERFSGETWFNIPTPMALLAGSGAFPFLLPPPRVIPARTTLGVTFQSAQAVSYDLAELDMYGGRIFYA